MFKHKISRGNGSQIARQKLRSFVARGIKPKIALKKSSAHLPLLLPSYLPTAFKEMLTAPQGKDNLKLTQSKVTKHCLESSDVFEKKSQISIVIAGPC